MESRVNGEAARPEEMAKDTLQTLREFLPMLRGSVHEAAVTLEGAEPGILPDAFFDRFSKLLDGLEVLKEAITTSKQILGVTSTASIKDLEQGLLVSMKLLLAAYEQQASAELRDTLEEVLLPNLEGWENRGVPTLIRSRDC